MTAGLVVAGGYSTRFGLAEKPLVEVAGEPLLVLVVRNLDPVVDDVVIDCRADQVAPFETALAEVAIDPRYAVDDEPDRGPIAGLATGLGEIDAVETVVLSCDRPGVTPSALDRLRSSRRRQNADVAVPVLDGRVQPLCGVYRTDALRTAVERAIEAGERRLCSIPRHLSSHVVTERALADVVEPAAIASVDTPLEARLWSPPVDRPAPGDPGCDRGDVSQPFAGD